MAIILFVILLIYTINLGNRVNKLEQQGKINQPSTVYNPATPPQSVPAPAVPQAPKPMSTPAFAPAQVSQAASPTRHGVGEDAIIRFFREDFLVKLGALLLLFAFGWGVSYAFTNNWIDPTGRIALGLGAGVAILGFATFWLRKNFHQAAIFLILGLSVFNLTTFAARFIYDLFHPAVALIMMFVAVAYVTFLSVRHNSQNLAFACLIFAGTAPLFTAGEPTIVGLFSYLIIFVLGVIWVVYIKSWHVLTFAALLVVSLYSVPLLYAGVADTEKITALAFVTAFGFIFFLFNYIAIIRNQSKVVAEHIYTAIGSSLFLTAWILSTTEGSLAVAFYVTWAIIFTFPAFTSLYLRHIVHAFYLYSASAIFFVAMATATYFSGAVLTLAYTIEVGLVVLLAQMILQRPAVTKITCALFIGPILLSLSSLASPRWATEILQQDFFVILVLALTVGCVGLILRRLDEATTEHALRPTANALLSVGALYLLLLLARSVGAQYDDQLLNLVLIIESGVAVFLLYAIYNHRLLTARFSYILVLSALVALPSAFSRAWETNVFHSDFLVLVAFIGTAGLVGLFLQILNRTDPLREITLISRAALYASATFALLLVWLALHATFTSDDTAVTVSLIVFTICGLAAYIHGRTKQITHYQYAGGILLAVVVGRLLLVDVWKMELLERFITFFMVGILLISTAFYGRKRDH